MKGNSSRSSTRTLSVPLRATLLGASLVAMTGCGVEDKSSGGGSETAMNLNVMSNGFGQLLPHQIQEINDIGIPQPVILQVRDQQTLIDNLRLDNPILPVAKFPEQTILPNGAAGNHYLFANFTQPIDVTSVLDGSPGSQASSGLSAAVSVTAIDPVSGDSAPIQGRVFVGGQTFANNPTSGAVELTTWVSEDSSGNLRADDPRAAGFPGVLTALQGEALLASPNTLIFIPDTDNNLSTFETFPTGLQIRMRITTALSSTGGKELSNTALGSTTVGADFLAPEIITAPPPLNAPAINPGNGDLGVDPLTNIVAEFTEPLQPLTLGSLNGAGVPNTSAGFSVTFGPPTAPTDMPFTVRPVSVYDLSRFEIIPAFNFPGSGPVFQDCATFSRVNIQVNAGAITDLSRNVDPNDATQVIPNTNTLSATTFFQTGEGPGIANMPVLPEAIYALRSGAAPGISVIDLNGFGAGTGNPSFTLGIPREGETKFPFDPNVSQQSGLLPPLNQGSCTIDGGSAGVFTLSLDSSLRDFVVQSPTVANVTDLHAGHSLDVVFNNSLDTCQSSGALVGGDVCAASGRKVSVPASYGPNTIGPAAQNQFGGVSPGAENFISWAPHPNPPPLVFPPLCVVPFLNAQEPTSVDHFIGPPPAGLNNNPLKQNLLVPGDPFGNPEGPNPQPPRGKLAAEQNQFFMGPSQGQVLLDACNLYQLRQQVGHFLYVVDRQRREITVLNSNRMTVIDRIQVADPTSLAMGTNLDFLAVSNQSADTVVFIDIDPTSSTFHQIIKETEVGRGPRGLAWQPESEDILVCNELDSSVSIISASSLEVRRVVSSQLNRPFEVCIYPRMVNYSFNRVVYYAYILNRSGTVAIFESGPNGINGWGYDDILGVAPYTFLNPKTIQPDPNNLNVGAWVVHEGPLDPITNNAGQTGEGALTQIFVESSQSNAIPLDTTGSVTPQLRAMEIGIRVSMGEDVLSGVPVDIAFDNLRNFGGLPNPVSQLANTSAAPLPQNSKGMIRTNPSTAQIDTCIAAEYMFAAVPNSNGGAGVIDVLNIGSAGTLRVDTNPYLSGIQSINAPNTNSLADYWRQ